MVKKTALALTLIISLCKQLKFPFFSVLSTLLVEERAIPTHKLTVTIKIPTWKKISASKNFEVELIKPLNSNSFNFT